MNKFVIVLFVACAALTVNAKPFAGLAHAILSKGEGLLGLYRPELGPLGRYGLEMGLLEDLHRPITGLQNPGHDPDVRTLGQDDDAQDDDAQDGVQGNTALLSPRYDPGMRTLGYAQDDDCQDGDYADCDYQGVVSQPEVGGIMGLRSLGRRPGTRKY